MHLGTLAHQLCDAFAHLKMPQIALTLTSPSASPQASGIPMVAQNNPTAARANETNLRWKIFRKKYFKNGSWKNHRKLKWFLSPFNLEKFQFVYCQKMMVAKEHHTKTITIQHHSKWKMCHAPTNCPIDPRITPSLRILVARCKCYSIHHWSGGRSNERKHPQSQAAKHQAPGIMSWYSEKNKNTIGYSLLFQPPSWNGNEYIYIERERERERFPIFVRPFEAWSSQTRWWSNSYPVDFPLLTHPSFELERLRQGRECCWPPNRQVECSCHWCRTCRLVKKRLFVDWVDWFWWFMFRFLVKGQTMCTIMIYNVCSSNSFILTSEIQDALIQEMLRCRPSL